MEETLQQEVVIKRKDKIEMKVKIIIYTFITSVFLTGCGEIEAEVLDSAVTDSAVIVEQTEDVESDVTKKGEQSIGKWNDAYIDFLMKMQNDSSEPQAFLVKDVNNNGVPELILCTHGTCLQVYAFEEGKLIEGGRHEFSTGTIRYFISEKEQYPGIFCYYVGGGFEHYCYLSFDEELKIEKLWNKDFTGISEKLEGRKKIENLSDDKSLIEESKKVVEDGNEISFLKITTENINEFLVI